MIDPSSITIFIGLWRFSCFIPYTTGVGKHSLIDELINLKSLFILWCREYGDLPYLRNIFCIISTLCFIAYPDSTCYGIGFSMEPTILGKFCNAREKWIIFVR